MYLCDLHVHSNFSDGTCDPEQVVRLAKEAGLSAVALTDHNSIDGLDLFLAAGDKYGVKTVPGIEISTDYNGVELHVVSLCFEKEYFSKIKEFMSIPKARKEESNRLLALKLSENGYKVNYEEILAKTTGFPNRVHFAKELIEKGYIKTIEEGFETILSEEQGYYVPPKRLTVFETLEFINSIKGVSVLAHPLLNLTKEELVDFLPGAIKCGLDAIEVRYSKYDDEKQNFSEKIVEDFNLLPSGGSDFHGENKPDIFIGSGCGNLQIPYDYLLKLEERKTEK